MLSRSNLTGASWDEVWANSESNLVHTADRRAPGRGKKKVSRRNDKAKVAMNTTHPTPHDAFACTVEDQPDPLCDLYFRGFSSSFDDIMDVYQKDGQYRKSHIDINEQQEDDITPSTPIDTKATANVNNNDVVTKVSAKEGWAEEESNQSKTTRKNQYINIGAYLISGVLMVFILECFIKMGMAISISNRALYG
jgi:hypothetical protein